ncbi:hypothetical protein RvY_12670 [Ramazzottius varieornatus]|uniref:Uncharacterized protein n=1 Tax=Ramazzottius varieornatus TaxID=947166 RepID=A0A1D1VKB3_RAMVA|nr:hypothetical protein RvY_12670 [Ramazzottius varieornatus]
MASPSTFRAVLLTAILLVLCNAQIREPVRQNNGLGDSLLSILLAGSGLSPVSASSGSDRRISDSDRNEASFTNGGTISGSASINSRDRERNIDDSDRLPITGSRRVSAGSSSERDTTSDRDPTFMRPTPPPTDSDRDRHRDRDWELVAARRRTTLPSSWSDRDSQLVSNGDRDRDMDRDSLSGITDRPVEETGSISAWRGGSAGLNRDRDSDRLVDSSGRDRDRFVDSSDRTSDRDRLIDQASPSGATRRPVEEVHIVESSNRRDSDRDSFAASPSSDRDRNRDRDNNFGTSDSFSSGSAASNRDRDRDSLSVSRNRDRDIDSSSSSRLGGSASSAFSSRLPENFRVEVEVSRFENKGGVSANGAKCDVLSACDTKFYTFLDTESANIKWPGATPLARWPVMLAVDNVDTVSVMRSISRDSCGVGLKYVNLRVLVVDVDPVGESEINHFECPFTISASNIASDVRAADWGESIDCNSAFQPGKMRLTTRMRAYSISSSNCNSQSATVKSTL